MPPLIRAMFYEDEPVYEIDFKQLELFAIAELSGDEQLIDDLNNGRDIHYETGRQVFGWTNPTQMSEIDRRTIKSVVFGLAYGGSAGTLSEQAGISKQLAQNIIEAFYFRYPEVKTWHANITHAAIAASYQTGEVHPDGSVRRATKVETAITGRVHLITDSKSPDWLFKRTGERYSITPTKVKNYKPQGFAGGDIVKTFSRVFFYLIGGNNSTIRLHNTVHDSLVISSPDISKELLDNSVVQALAYVKKYYNMQTELQVNVKSTGNYWR
jgi:DNA polymerase I